MRLSLKGRQALVGVAVALPLVVGLACSWSDPESEDPRSPASTSTTLGAAPALDPSAAAGSRANPYAVGATVELGGWAVRIAGTASNEGEGLGSLLELTRLAAGEGRSRPDLDVVDGAGAVHRMGGPACWADAAGDLDRAPTRVGEPSTTAVCWTVPVDAQPDALLRVTAPDRNGDPAYLRLR